MRRIILVVPCYNEANRLDFEKFRALATIPGLSLLFVNDGSADATGTLLDRLASDCPDWASVLHLLENGGKAEAVRLGLLTALATGAEAVGYDDADLVTSPADMARLLDCLEEGPWSVVLASRVRTPGACRHGRRSSTIVVRIFNWFATHCLGIDIRDTQCGARLFRAGPALEEALAEPFRSRWTLDVELIGRLLTGTPGLAAADLLMMPLTCGRDVAGSRLRIARLPGLLLGLWRSGMDLRSRRRAREFPPGRPGHSMSRPYLPLARIPLSPADQAIGASR